MTLEEILAEPTTLPGDDAGVVDDEHRLRVERAFAAFAFTPDARPPLPGSGHTARRWAMLADRAEQDLALGRLVEGHTDALAIIAEITPNSPPSAGRWGVWTAQPPGSVLTATPRDGQWVIDGRRRYCSGARVCSQALVTATAPDGTRLFTVALDHPGVRPLPGTWPAVGMAASDTLDVAFEAVPAEPVGDVDAYTGRPGFHHGGVGVAVCWYGGARAVARPLREAAHAGRLDAHGLAHLGAVDVALDAAEAVLARAAAEIDADPADLRGGAEIRALRVRAAVEEVCARVLGHVGRALGAEPLCHDGRHARAVADLTVYIRQHHGERDLARLGELVGAQPLPADPGAGPADTSQERDAR